MNEFLNYVPPEGSIGELLMKLIPATFTVIVVILGAWLLVRELRKAINNE